MKKWKFILVASCILGIAACIVASGFVQTAQAAPGNLNQATPSSVGSFGQVIRLQDSGKTITVSVQTNLTVQLPCTLRPIYDPAILQPIPNRFMPLRGQQLYQFVAAHPGTMVLQVTAIACNQTNPPTAISPAAFRVTIIVMATPAAVPTAIAPGITPVGTGSVPAPYHVLYDIYSTVLKDILSLFGWRH